MPLTYSPIASNVLTGNQATVTFSSIPSGFTDLFFILSVRSDRVSAVDYLFTTLNSATTNYSESFITSYDVTVTTNRYTTQAQLNTNLGIDSAGNTANAFSSVDIYIPNYINNTAKILSSFAVAEDNSTGFAWQNSLGASLWNDTTAISSIIFKPGYGSNFVTGSRFDLYGILKA